MEVARERVAEMLYAGWRILRVSHREKREGHVCCALRSHLLMHVLQNVNLFKF